MQTTPSAVSAGDRVRVLRWAVSADGPRDENGLIRDAAGEVVTIDDNVTVPPGTEGTVQSTDDTGTVHVEWDNGSRLGLIAGRDEWEPVVEP